MLQTVTFTHKGWFGLCPVYFADLDTEAPFVDPRHWLFEPLMWVSEVLFTIGFAMLALAKGEHAAGYPLLETARLDTPLVRSFLTPD